MSPTDPYLLAVVAALSAFAGAFLMAAVTFIGIWIKSHEEIEGPSEGWGE